MAQQGRGNGLKVLLIDRDAGRSAILEQALSDAGHRVVARVSDQSDLYRQVAAAQPDVIIIDLESPDRDTLEQMSELNRDQPRPVVMFAEDDDHQSIEAAIRAGVSAYVVDGLNPKRVKSLLDVAVARFREYQALRSELEKAKSTLAERKNIDRAKGLLMKRRGYSEDEAYQALRKLAMDSNRRIADIAENLLAMADVLL